MFYETIHWLEYFEICGNTKRKKAWEIIGSLRTYLGGTKNLWTIGSGNWASVTHLCELADSLMFVIRNKWISQTRKILLSRASLISLQISPNVVTFKWFYYQKEGRPTMNKSLRFTFPCADKVAKGVITLIVTVAWAGQKNDVVRFASAIWVEAKHKLMYLFGMDIKFFLNGSRRFSVIKCDESLRVKHLINLCR